MTETTSRTIKEEQTRRIAADAAQVNRIAALEASMANVILSITKIGGAVTPPPPTATVPGAPTIGTALAGDAQATVSFGAPVSNGGSPITSYTVTSTPGSLTSTGASSPLTVTGLTNSTAYTFKVHATNAVGSGADSAASNSATPTGALPPPPPPPDPPPSSPRPWALPVTTVRVNVPSSIDATGATDVTAALQAFLNSVPDGSMIMFGGPTKTYKISSHLDPSGWNHRILDGQGATINNVANANNGTAFPTPDFSNAASTFYWNWGATKPTHITIRNFVARFASPSPGVFQSGEAAAFLHSMGGSYLEVDNVTMSGLFGDMVTVNENSGYVWAHDCVSANTGRHMLSVMCGHDIIMERCTNGPSGYGVFDIEPEAGSIAGVSNVWFQNNRMAAWGTNTFASIDGVNAGKSISNIHITGNTLTGKQLKIRAADGTTSRVQNLYVNGNVSNTPSAGPIFTFAHIDHLDYSGNTQPLSSGSLASVSDCTSVTA